MFACHALRGRGGEHPYFSWPTAQSLEVLRVSYAPPKNQTKRWPTEAQMEGWFPRTSGEQNCQRLATQWDRTGTESSNRAARSDSTAAQAKSRAPRLNSRPSSQNGSRRPDRRICDEWGSTSCDPTLWKEKQERFSVRLIIGIMLNHPNGGPAGAISSFSVGCARCLDPVALASRNPDAGVPVRARWDRRCGVSVDALGRLSCAAVPILRHRLVEVPGLGCVDP